MAEKKEKKVTEREKFMNEAAQMFMQAMNLDVLYRTKEGLLFDRGEEQVVLKFIQKKNKVFREDIVEEIARIYDFETLTNVVDESEVPFMAIDEDEAIEVAM